MSGIPDLLPPLSVMAAVRNGTARLTNAARLRMKESDRLQTTAAMVNSLGGSAEEGPDFLTIHGKPTLSRRNGGRCGRSPHRHGRGHCRRLLHRSHHHFGGGGCQQVLSRFLGGIQTTGR